MSLVGTVQALTGQGRVADALAATETAASVPGATSDVLQARAMALKAADRLAEAATFNRRAVETAPNDRIAWHNLAATLGDLALHDEAADAARRALGLGLQAPETRLVLGRALQGQARFDEAEAVFREALGSRPDYDEAHRDLAQLQWMRTGDLGSALKTLDGAIATAANPALHTVRALVLDRAGLTEQALDETEAALKRWPQDVRLKLAAATYAGDLGRVDEALAYAEAAWAAAPGHPVLLEALAVAQLGAGRADAAFNLADRRLSSAPYDQMALALKATAARVLGRPEYETLYAYEQFVRPDVIDTPEGWPSLDAYLADLKGALTRLHALHSHPLENSLRGGSQTAQNLLQSDEPAIRAFFRAIERPIRDYMAALGPGDDPLRARNTGDYAVRGAWSVKLRSGGRHVDHVHPQGWLSSAFYVETPDEALDTLGREGWIRFGRPRHRVKPAQQAAKYLRPRPGVLVLFPSYMWHGTVPFTTQETRMTVAFDVVPK